MIRHPYPGAQYADARVPDRAFAVLYPMSHLETSIGRITVPLGDEPLYHRIPPTGAVWIAGQAHFGNCTWFYDGKEWRRFQAACGVSPVIFDLMSHLHISDCSIGSQGWRYVQRDGTPEGRLVTGDATYGPFHGLSEFTDLGDDLLLGQGNKAAGCPIDGGAVLRDGAVWRLLEPGACRFIRADRVGDEVSVALWKEGYGAVVCWLTVAELRGLPLLGPIPPVDRERGPINQ